MTFPICASRVLLYPPTATRATRPFADLTVNVVLGHAVGALAEVAADVRLGRAVPQ